MVTIALLVILNGLAAWIWSAETRNFPSPFAGVVDDRRRRALASRTSACIVVTLVARRCCCGRSSASRGSASRCARRRSGPTTSRLLGVRVGWMLALGWGFAAVLGAVSGMMVAPVVFLDPTMMLAVLTYAFAAAVLGGIDSPVGAVVGGLALGVDDQPARHLRRLRQPELELPVAFAVLIGVLLIRPAGLFGRVVVRRV